MPVRGRAGPTGFPTDRRRGTVLLSWREIRASSGDAGARLCRPNGLPLDRRRAAWSGALWHTREHVAQIVTATGLGQYGIHTSGEQGRVVNLGRVAGHEHHERRGLALVGQ